MAEMNYYPHRIGSKDDPRIKALGKKYGKDPAFSKFFIIIEMLYQIRRPTVDFNNELILRAFADEVELTPDEFIEFVNDCVDLHLFNEVLWQDKILCSDGVAEQINYVEESIEQKRQAGIKSGEARRKKAQERKESQSS